MVTWHSWHRHNMPDVERREDDARKKMGPVPPKNACSSALVVVRSGGAPARGTCNSQNVVARIRQPIMAPYVATTNTPTAHRRQHTSSPRRAVTGDEPKRQLFFWVADDVLRAPVVTSSHVVQRERVPDDAYHAFVECSSQTLTDN